jgi:hypothetical protein
LKQQGWDEVRAALRQKDTLYTFSEQAQQLIQKWEAHVQLLPTISPSLLRKSLAALLFRLSKLFLFDTNQPEGNNNSFASQRRLPTFGEVLGAVAKIPGCAGGGSDQATIGDMLTGRVGFKVSASDSRFKQGENDYSFTEDPPCRSCGDTERACGPCKVCWFCDGIEKFRGTLKRAA